MADEKVLKSHVVSRGYVIDRRLVEGLRRALAERSETDNHGRKRQGRPQR